MKKDLKKENGINGLDIGCAALGILQILSLLMFLVMPLTNISTIITEGFISGVLLLIALVYLIIIRKKEVTKVWKRVLIAGMICSGFAILLVAGMMSLLLYSVEVNG